MKCELSKIFSGVDDIKTTIYSHKSALNNNRIWIGQKADEHFTLMADVKKRLVNMESTLTEVNRLINLSDDAIEEENRLEKLAKKRALEKTLREMSTGDNYYGGYENKYKIGY